MKIGLNSVLSIVLLLCAGLAWHYKAEAVRLRAELAAQSARLEEQLGRQAADRQETVARAVPPVVVAETPESPLAGTEPEAEKEDGRNPFAKTLAEMMNDPQMKEVMRNQQKMVVRQMYGALGRYLVMDGESREQLDELLAERQAAFAELGMAMMGQSRESGQALAEQMGETKAAFDEKLKELLGDEGYAAFQHYEERMAEHTNINMFKGTLPEEEALTEQQETELVELMYAARKENPEYVPMNQAVPDMSMFTPEKMEENLAQMEKVQQRYVAAAEEVLTPVQFKRFAEWQEQMAGMQRMGLKMMGNMRGTEKQQEP